MQGQVGSSSEVQGHNSQDNGRTAGDPAGPILLLRTIPRAVWFTLSALVLVVAAVLWHQRESRWVEARGQHGESVEQLSWGWWGRPWLHNANAALPDVSGRIYGVAVEPLPGQKPPGRRTRLWIAGTAGFLAYSDDQGGCFTIYEYDTTSGQLRPPSKPPCQSATETTTAASRAGLVPTVWAAERPESQSSQSQPSAQSQSPAQNGSSAKKPSQQNNQSDPRTQQYPASSSIQITPSTLDFGNLDLGTVAPAQRLTIQNTSGETLRISFTRFSGDTGGEFTLSEDCQSPIVVKGSCYASVQFKANLPGKKSVSLGVGNSLSSELTILRISANVDGSPAAQPQNSPDPSKPGEAKADVPAQSQKSQSAEPRSGSDQTAKSDAGRSRFDTPVQASVPRPVPPPASTTKGTEEKQPAPPSNPPDLLAIGFEEGGKMVGTGGELWELGAGNVWARRRGRSGEHQEVGGDSWSLTGNGTWAKETHIGSERFGAGHPACPKCTITSRASDRSTRWVAGWIHPEAKDLGVLFRSLDGGAWEPMTRGAAEVQGRTAAETARPWVWPPVWYVAILLLSALLAAPALLPPPDRKVEDPSSDTVEQRLSSDKPLDPGDPDVLGLTAIALGLSRFLRNEKTLPPLTIAVNGEWGTGKSSLMNLLRCDLKSYGMRPVWFNAWHHQKEEHLLAALLQTVRLEAVPPWSLLALPFRVRLLSYHLRRRWPVLVIVAAVAFFLVMIDYHLRLHDRSDLFLWLADQIFPSANHAHEGVSEVPVQGGLLAVLAAAGALWKGLTAFGANPASLLASVAKGNKLKDLDSQTSFRQKFAVEFREFTRALGPRRPLVVFVDDLDRCLPANVRDVLEAVNFLVSSGDCFVVLGMDRVQVQRAVGLSFKEVAEETGPKRTGPAAAAPASAEALAEAAREKRAEFAQKYLEKLINLEVRVPLAIDDATKQRLFERAPVKPQEPAGEKALRYGLKIAQSLVPAVLAVLLFVSAFQLSTVSLPAVEQWIKESTEQAKQKAAQPDQAANQAAPPAEQRKEPAGGPATGGSAPAASVPGHPDTLIAAAGVATELRAAKEIWPAPWLLTVPFYLVAIFLLMVANVALTTRPGVVTHDSQSFANAMEKVWYPLVLAKQNTPRAAKRFVNRVRYLAMRQQAFVETASWWERSLFPDRLKEPARTKGWEPIPEPLLVALAAMEQMEPVWIYDQKVFTGLAAGKVDPPADAPWAQGLLLQAQTKHDKFFLRSTAAWTDVPKYRDTFLAIWPQSTPGESGNGAVV